MKKENLAINSLLSILFAITTGIFSFVINRVFGEQIGQSYLGVLRIFTQFISYLSLAELGIGVASSVLLYKPLNTNDYNKVSSVFFTLDFFYKRIALAILLLGGLLGIFLSFFIKGVDVNSDIYICWLLYVISVSISYCFSKYSILFSADQKYGFVLITRNIIKIFLQVMQVISLMIYNSFVIFVLLIVVATIFEYAINNYYFKKNYKLKLNSCYKLNKQVMSKTGNVFIHKISSVLVFNTDYLIISKFLGVNTVAIYSSYIMLSNFIMVFVSSLVNVIKPRFGLFVASSSKENIYNLWLRSFSINSYVSIVLISFLYVSFSPLIKIWMGDTYLLKDEVVNLILVNIFFSFFRISMDLIKESSGYFKDIHLPIIEGLTNLILSLVLVNYYGLTGVIVGTILSNILIILIWKPIIVFKHVLNISINEYIKNLIKYIVIFSIVMSVFKYIKGLYIIDDFFDICLFIPISIFIPLFIFLMDNIFRDVFKTMIKYLIKKRSLK
ncbi:TPA: lipopolysaccharide biosynthesis protein [Photobacterium damselae]